MSCWCPYGQLEVHLAYPFYWYYFPNGKFRILSVRNVDKIIYPFIQNNTSVIDIYRLQTYMPFCQLFFCLVVLELTRRCLGAGMEHVWENGVIVGFGRILFVYCCFTEFYMICFLCIFCALFLFLSKCHFIWNGIPIVGASQSLVTTNYKGVDYFVHVPYCL